jgi:hypothetical protein
MLALIGQAKGKKVQTYVSVKDACKISGYKQQYVRRLLRQKKTFEKKDRTSVAYRSFFLGKLFVFIQSSKRQKIWTSNKEKNSSSVINCCLNGLREV